MSNSPEKSGGVDRIEKRVMLTACLVTCLGLGLIAYAAWGMGIAVPDCVSNSKIFEHGSIAKRGDKTYEVHFVASMWQFEPSRVTVPVGSTLDLFVISKDVTHGFDVLGTNVNLMAEPAVVNEARVHFGRRGVYRIICHEYCGAGHQDMNAAIEVSDTVADISAEGLPAPENPAGSLGAGGALPGKAIFEEKGCNACHTVDGSAGLGPTLKGLWGSKAELDDGTVRTVNEEYVEQMIRFPEKQRVKGFSPIMPKLPVTQQEMEQIVEYLKSLR